MLPAFEPTSFPDSARALRSEVREFLAAELAAGSFVPRSNSWTIFDPAFSRRLGQRGYIGMTWPKEYGGRGMSSLERFVVIEELLAHGAPVGAHWVSDRQSGGQILKFGREDKKRDLLPRMARGECYFGIGMSEPDVGSDLASVRSRGEKVNSGWRINGTKVWTTSGHRKDYLIALIRTTPGSQRQQGLTQFIIDLKKPGVRRSGIENLAKQDEFSEIHFEDYIADDADILGEVGQGWHLVTHELAQERSGPERFMSDFTLLVELVRRVEGEPAAQRDVGHLIARLLALREMSVSVAGMLTRGQSPELAAALVKDLGTQFERDLPEQARLIAPSEPSMGDSNAYVEALAHTILYAPSFTLRGGTREVLRGIIARHLGLR